MAPPPDCGNPRGADAIRACLAGSAHLNTLVGLMQQDGIRFVHADATTPHGVQWSAVLVQGPFDVAALGELALAFQQLLERERAAERARTQLG